MVSKIRRARQGNMASKLANFLINMKLWECVPMMMLYKISEGDFFIIDRKLINYSCSIIDL